MIHIPGYENTETIFESNNSVVYRGLRTEDAQPIILKVLKGKNVSSLGFSSFKHEFTITRSLKLDCVIEAYDLLSYNDTLVIIFEDFGGESLDHLMAAEFFSVERFLLTAIEITDAIGKIHAAGITHKDINPSNIIINPETGQLKIIDFGISTALSFQNPLQNSPSVLRGTLAYMSPEQTGRMNRTVDYRSDFYSLGVTLYEMICRKRPFESSDSVELVHAHIAKMPLAPNLVDPKIPESASHIIMKLLAKNAEDRYQSPQGIRLDLEECLRQWQASGRIAPFEIARHDFSDKLQIPDKIFGRDHEIELLMNTFQRVAGGGREILLISGAPGIGKTSLVKEAYKQASLHAGQLSKVRFISGKFDRFQHNIPYSALVNAFRELVRQLLSESDTELVHWRKRILASLGPNGRIITDVIPELELIIGQQPPLAALGPMETQNRFNLVFRNFIRALCKSEKPLTIFLDDLQWADAASLKLIELMMADQKLRYLFLVIAYRDNEVNANGRLICTIESLDKKGARIEEIHLVPLDKEKICHMIADWLSAEKAQVRPLADFISQKAEGNPFFAEIFLKSLHTQKLLAFDSQEGCWKWELEKIKNLGLTDNVVELLASKIQQFKPETQKVLQQAACIGIQFDIQTLARVCNMSAEDTAASLQEAVSEGLVIPMGHAFDMIKGAQTGSVEGSVDKYGFNHDRIQQAAYQLIDTEERTVVHQQVGRHFLESTLDDQKREKIFDIVNQLNLGLKLIERQVDRDELAQLNLTAGKRAKASAAYEPALNYFQIGIGLLGEDGWKSQYEVTLAMYVEATEAAYLCAAYDEMDKFVGAVLRNARTLLDKVKVQNVQIDAFKAQYKLQEALQTAKPVLKLLGVNLPAKPNNFHIILDFAKTKLKLAGKKIDKLIDLPQMNDKIKLSSAQVMLRVSSAAYFSAPQLLPLIVFRGVRFLVKYGNAAEAAYLYSLYGLILCGVVGDITSGYQFGQLALRILEKFKADELKAKTYFMVHGFIMPWKKHIRDAIAPFAEAFQSGQETGDFEYGGLSRLFYTYCSFLSGIALTKVEEEAAYYSDAIGQLKHETSFHMHEIYHQTILNLMGKSKNPQVLIGSRYDEIHMLPFHIQANDNTTLCNLYLSKLYLNYLFNKAPKAVENAVFAEKYLDGVVGTPAVPVFHFYDSLSRMALFPESHGKEQRRILKKVNANQKKMKKWARHAPMNYLHKFHLVEAQRYRILGRDAEAAECYDQAIQLAKKHEYTNEEALANELAGKFYLARGKFTIARAYLKEARDCYQRWGALAKVKHLDECHGQFIANLSESAVLEIGEHKRPVEAPGLRSEENLDLAAVMKASQAISGEIIMANLLKQLMNIIVANAGAQKGFIILNTDGRLRIEASINSDPPAIDVLQSIPLEQCPNLSLEIVRFVFRSAEDLVLNDGSDAKQFERDNYIVRQAPKSILCMPIRQKDVTSGVLYLENNLTTSAFTEDRIQVLRILLSQAAISIENAGLYENLKREIADRKQAQEDLLHLATAIEQAAEGIVITEKDGTLRYANPAFERITGYSQKEIKGKNISIFRSDHHDESFYEDMWRSTLSGNVWAGRVTTKKKDNETCQLELTLSPVRDSANNVISLVAVTRDVSHEIQMEKELRQAQKMEAIGTLAGGVAHDFNNILAAILGYTELSLLNLPEDNQARKQLKEVLKAVNRAKELVSQILSFSRQNEQEMKPVEPALIVKEALKLLRASLPATIEMCTNIAVNGANVLADPTQIHQVVMNLCTNAGHAMHADGGTLEVSLINEEVDIDKASHNPNLKPGPYLNLTVKDTGQGIESSIMDHIFEPFFTTKEPGEGTGMGLAVVHGIVQRHGGTISVESEPGKGTIFHVLLPRLIRRVPPKGQADIVKYPTGKERILFVDDEETIVDIGRTILKGLGYEVVTKTSSLVALETFKTEADTFDLVITDQTMPKMTGVELAKSCMRIRPDIPMILCSGYSQTITAEEAKMMGIREFIMKPFSIETIAQTVRKVLENESSLKYHTA